MAAEGYEWQSVDQPRLHGRKLPALHRFRRGQPSEDFARISGQDEKPRLHLISHELTSRQSCPDESILLGLAQTNLEHRLYRAISELERLQRRRRGEAVPPTINVEVSRE